MGLKQNCAWVTTLPHYSKITELILYKTCKVSKFQAILITIPFRNKNKNSLVSYISHWLPTNSKVAEIGHIAQSAYPLLHIIGTRPQHPGCDVTNQHTATRVISHPFSTFSFDLWGVDERLGTFFILLLFERVHHE